MSDVLIHPPGTVSWVDLGTTDPDGARAFYARLFGWQTAGDGDGASYTRFHRDGIETGGAYPLSADQKRRGVRPHWLPHLATSDLEATRDRAVAHGATVVADVFEAKAADGTLQGRGAVLKDPTGAVFALWEAHAHRGIGALPDGRHGTEVWIELATRDLAAAKAFYTAVFDYTLTPMNVEGMDYTILGFGDHGVGGVYPTDASYGEMPSHWMVYFAVDDTDAAAAEAEAAGGQACVPPTDIPGVGRFAVLNDPQGATFSILKPIPKPL